MCVSFCFMHGRQNCWRSETFDVVTYPTTLVHIAIKLATKLQPTLSQKTRDSGSVGPKWITDGDPRDDGSSYWPSRLPASRVISPVSMPIKPAIQIAALLWGASYAIYKSYLFNFHTTHVFLCGEFIL